MIKTVFFDLGNVLVFFSHEKMIAQLATCTGLSERDIRKLLFETTLREDYEKGKINTEQLYHRFQQATPKPFSLSELKTALCNIFIPNLELWPVVEQLKKKGIRLVLLSNTSECHHDYIDEHYPILKLFDHKILSYEVGAWKPDPLIFQKALEAANCKPEECFYTDDIPEFILSARKEGLPGEIFTNVPRLKEILNKKINLS